MGFENPFGKKKDKNDSIPDHVKKVDEHNDNIGIKPGSEYADIANKEHDDDFLKDKEDRYMVNTSKSGNLYKGEYKEAGNVVDPESDTELLDKELFGEENEEDPEDIGVIRRKQAEEMRQYNKEHAGENGASGVKRPDISKANFTEKVSLNYDNKFRKPRPVVQSTENLEEKDKKAA